MSSMIINNLYIFSTSEKKACSISFVPGKNIITSSIVDGTKRGKSAILKSLYYALGADCYFEDMWDVGNKTYVINFSISQKSYYVYRYDRLFKVFSADCSLLYSGIGRTALAEFLATIYHFKIKLPERETLKLVTVPPAFSYVLNYIDQDRMNGSEFNSFKMGQFTNYKENVLYAQFGIFNDEYYDLLNHIDELKSEQGELQDDLNMLVKMIEKLEKSMGGASYSVNFESLKAEIQRNQLKYEGLAKSLSDTRTKLIELRNQEHAVRNEIDKLLAATRAKEKDIDKLNHHVCPMCKSRIEDTVELRITQYNSVDDIAFLQSNLEHTLAEIHEKISQGENRYRNMLESLKEYEVSIAHNSAEVAQALRHKGFADVKDQMNMDWRTTKSELEVVDTNLKNAEKKKREYSDLKKGINERYYSLMLQDKQRFGLQEIENEKLKNIRYTFNAGGSNKPIATIIWYFNLLKIKYEYNSDVLRFPLVLDSPNNVELDDEKKRQLFNYLFEAIDDQTQLIVSTLGFDANDYPEHRMDSVIFLENERYRLLNEKAYEENRHLLEAMTLANFE